MKRPWIVIAAAAAIVTLAMGVRQAFGLFLRGPSPTIEMNTRTTIVLGTVFEKPGFVPTELD